MAVGMWIVFGLIAIALVLFVTEAYPPDVTAIGVMAALALLGPFTGITARDAIAGFASPATVTIVAMYILSAGIQETGIVTRLGYHIKAFTRGSETRLLGATIGATSPIAGLINNTPVVAVFIPMVIDLAEDAGISPSKLLLPLSYAAMLGGTLTLVGTATNIVASDLSTQLLDHPISMFEFTPLGIIIVVTGSLYLFTIGRWLTPARIPPAEDMTAAFGLENYLAMARIREGSSLIGRRLSDIDPATDLEVLHAERDGVPLGDDPLAAGDDLTLKAERETIREWVEWHDLRFLPHIDVTEEDLTTEEGQGLMQLVLPADSRLIGTTIEDLRHDDRFKASILALRRGETVYRSDIADLTLGAGDSLLVRTERGGLGYLAEVGDVFLADYGDGPEALHEATGPPSISTKTPIAVSILLGAIGLAALGIAPIVITALAGVFAMILTGCLDPAEAYESVGWNVIFLLAGVLPLSTALQKTGGDAFIGESIALIGSGLPAIGILALFFLLSSLLANVVTPVASVALMIPVAVDTAISLGLEPFTFLLAVMFAGSTAFMTPIGYQTNLMVYGPGGYRFTDYVRVGAPLQLLLTVVTTAGLVFLWGL